MPKDRPDAVERRFVTVDDLEVREADDAVRFEGHAAVFNTETDLFFFREKVMPGAFKRTIRNKADVRFLFNHDPNTVMARTSAGNLKLREDDIGLHVDAELDPNDDDVKRLRSKVKNGNVTQMSFGFSPVRADMKEEDTDKPLRELREVKLFDVSPVTFPAYPETDAQIRGALELVTRYAEVHGLPVELDERGSDPDELAEALEVIRNTQTGADPESIRAAIDALTALLPQDSDAGSNAESVTPEVHSLSAEHARRIWERNRALAGV